MTGTASFYLAGSFNTRFYNDPPPFETTIRVREAERRFDQIVSDVATRRGVYLVAQHDTVCLAIISFETYTRWIRKLSLDHQGGTPLVAFISIESYTAY